MLDQLSEGGAAGHLAHPHEDLELTLGDVADMLRKIASGRAGALAEKLDGINVMFTCDDDGRVLVARNLSDIRAGGVTGDDMSARYAARSRAAIGEILRSASESIESALADVSKRAVSRALDSGRVWLSAEVIDPRWVNVISYDSSAVTVHLTPVIVVDSSGRIEKLTSHPAARALIRLAPALGPASKIDPSQLVSQRVKTAASEAEAALAQVGDSDDTLADVIRRAVSDELGEAAASRALGELSRAELKKIDARLPSDDVIEAAKKRAVAPVESAIRSFAVEALRSVKSALVSDATAHSATLSKKLTAAISSIEKLGDESDMRALASELSRLPAGEITQAIEGVVFARGGRAYKLTGAFAPINQIVSLARRLEQAHSIRESTRVDASALLHTRRAALLRV